MNSMQKYRLQAGFSRANAARQIGVSTVTLWRYERGMQLAKSETLKAMATLFGCSMEELLRSD